MEPELFLSSLFAAKRLDSKARGRDVSSRTLGSVDDKSTYAEGVTQIVGRCRLSNAFSVSHSWCCEPRVRRRPRPWALESNRVAVKIGKRSFSFY